MLELNPGVQSFPISGCPGYSGDVPRSALQYEVDMRPLPGSVSSLGGKPIVNKSTHQ
jgi:hypothetical protein